MTKKQYTQSNQGFVSHLKSFFTCQGEMGRKEFFIKAILLFLLIEITLIFIGRILFNLPKGFIFSHYGLIFFITDVFIPCLEIYPLFCLITQYYKTKQIHSVVSRVLSVIWFMFAHRYGHLLALLIPQSHSVWVLIVVFAGAIISAVIFLGLICKETPRTKKKGQDNLNEDRGCIAYTFEKIFNDSMRVNRSEYWWYMVLSMILYIPFFFEITGTFFIFGISLKTAFICVGVLCFFLVYLPIKFLQAKRVQDTNTSSSIVVVSVLLDIAFLLVWMFFDMSDAFRFKSLNGLLNLKLQAACTLIMWTVISSVNFILFILSIIPGTYGSNRYGEPTIDCGAAQIKQSKLELLKKAVVVVKTGLCR